MPPVMTPVLAAIDHDPDGHRSSFPLPPITTAIVTKHHPLRANHLIVSSLTESPNREAARPASLPTSRASD
jgi:hypothetical protein